jgi:uncharacterized protein (TIGR02145 family)
MLDGRRWMTRNLNIKTTNSYCYDDKESNCDRSGRLYTWEAAKSACDILGDGWRLPTHDEWREMAKQYGGVFDGSSNSGKSAYRALIDGGTSEFNALFGGGREPSGGYQRLDAHGFYWSATESDADHAWMLNFGKGAQLLNHHKDIEKSRAVSVRCIKVTSMASENGL